MPQSRDSLELPLLRLISRLGGTVIADAVFFRTFGEEHQLPIPARFDRKTKWVHDLHWVRYNLVQRGDLDGSQRGRWIITKQGQPRVAVAPNAPASIGKILPHNVRMPTYDRLFNPLLAALHALGGSATLTELSEQIIQGLRLPPEIIEQPHAGASAKTEVEYRLAWARTYLKKFGLIENSTRAVWALTPEGRQTVTVDPKEVVRKVQGKEKSQQVAAPAPGMTSPAVTVTPSWSERVLSLVLQMDPGAFERLCQRVLRESGFVQVEITGRSGDGGIDGYGVLRLAGLISFRVAFQCKRYQSNVASSVIRDFRGAIIGRAEKGLILTTAGFTRGAQEEAIRDGAPPIDLIDGDQFASKLKEFSLGVSTRQVVVEEIDVDDSWFSSI